MFRKSREKVKSVSVAIAVKLGFLPPKQQEAAHQLVQENEDCPTLSLLVKNGYVTEAQADQIRDVRAKEAPLDSLNESVKKARCAVRIQAACNPIARG